MSFEQDSHEMEIVGASTTLMGNRDIKQTCENLLIM
jgi:hypothetical protein